MSDNVNRHAKVTHLFRRHPRKTVRRREQAIPMERVSKIRRWVPREGRSIRSVAQQTGLSRDMVGKWDQLS